MVPATQNIKVMRGDTEVFIISIVDSNSNPVELMGSTFASQIRYDYSSPSIAASFTCVVTDPDNGVVTLTLSAADSSFLNVGLAYWDLQRTEGAVVNTILSGKCNVLADVTKI